MVIEQVPVLRRPRTRALVRAEMNNARELDSERPTMSTYARRPSQGQQSYRQIQSQGRGNNAWRSVSTRRLSNARTDTIKVGAWLDTVEPFSQVKIDQVPMLSSKDESPLPKENEMDCSSFDDGSSCISVAGMVKRRECQLTSSKLRLRQVMRKKDDDSMMESLQKPLERELLGPSVESAQSFITKMQELFEKVQGDATRSGTNIIEEITTAFDAQRAQIRYPTISKIRLNALLEECRADNKEVLLETIIMEFFHYYQSDTMLDWNAETEWLQRSQFDLPSQLDDDIPPAKPHIAFSFALRSFTGGEVDSDPIPKHLERCILPDSSTRCFPFLFIEKASDLKAASDLQAADLKNLHHASQALYNMYQWALQTGEQDVYIQKVRVFSFVFDTRGLSVRVHRILQTDKGTLSFRFDEFPRLSLDDRERVFDLVDNLLQDYVKSKLHGILLKSYREVIEQERKRISAVGLSE